MEGHTATIATSMWNNSVMIAVYALTAESVRGNNELRATIR
jgi:hypothetical protein